MTLDHSRTEPDVTLDIPKVAKQNWKSKDIRDTWDGPLESFVEARSRVTEAALRDEDHPRTMLRRTLPAEDASDLLSELSDDVDVARHDHDDKVVLVLTTSDCPIDGEAVLEGAVDPLDELQSRGVPECCAAAYKRHRSNGWTDPIAAIAQNTPSTVERGGELVVEDPHPILNTLWAFQGWGFVEFYPCSFECDRARQVAIETGRIFRETGDGDAADAAFEFLSDATYWSGYHGLAHVKNSWSIGEYTTDEYWHERTVRFNGYHEDIGDVDSVEFDG